MKPTSINYGGKVVSRDWPSKVEEAQDEHCYVIWNRRYNRIRYGAEDDGCWRDSFFCEDCQASHGQYHVSGCKFEQCPSCGAKAVDCDCEYD